MKFKPLLGTDLSGHIGGIVASHNTYGPYFRQRVRPANKKTPYQQQQRTAIAYTSQSWRSLDPLVQAAWNAADVVKTSRKGDKVHLSGQAAFMYVNAIRARALVQGIVPGLITTPPTGDSQASLTPITTNPTSSTTVDLNLTPTDSWRTAGGCLIVSAGLLTSNGQTYKTAALGAGFITGTQATPASLTLPFVVPIGARCRLQFHALDQNGRQSTYQTTDFTNVAFPPPPLSPRNVLEVTLIGVKKYLWRFDGPVTVAPGADANLVINADASGVAAQAGPNNVEVTYTTTATTPVAWSIALQPASITETVRLPQSGLTD